MSSNTPEGLSPYASSCTVTQEEFAALKARVAELEEEKDERVNELEETVARQSKEIKELHQENEEQSQHIEELEAELADERTERAKEDAQDRKRIKELEQELKEERETRAKADAQDRKRLHDVEEHLDNVEEGSSPNNTPTPQTEETTLYKPETPLEDVIRVPEHLVEDSLSANQQRARFVAKDIHQYSKSVPAGRAIKSSELRRVLSAHEEGQVYTETVSRVIRFLDDLGQDDVTMKETQGGERVVVFTDEFVKRIVAYRNQSNSVVTGEEATE